MKIFMWTEGGASWGYTPDTKVGIALTEDGQLLCNVAGSSEEEIKVELGFEDPENTKHQIYGLATGDDYEIEWIDNPSENELLHKARSLSRLHEDPSDHFDGEASGHDLWDEHLETEADAVMMSDPDHDV